MRKDYDTEAIKLAKAVDIAIDSFIKFPPKDFTKENVDHFVNLYSKWKNSVINPEPKFRKIASLKFHIQDVFTYFQESDGEAVEHFWRQLGKENLGFTREDKLRKIIRRGKIMELIEYDLVVDSMSAAEQEKRITRQEAKLLSEMLGEFESRKQKKK